MTISIDYANKLVLSTASITDCVAFHKTLRDFEDNPDGIFYPAIHTYKEISLGGGAIFPAIEFINGWQLKFPNAGSYTISGGNILAQIVPVPGVFIMQTQSAAYSITSVGGSGNVYTPSQVADAVWQHTSASVITTRLTEAWGRLGLDINKPLITGNTQISFGDIIMALTETSTSVTVTRQ